VPRFLPTQRAPPCPDRSASPAPCSLDYRYMYQAGYHQQIRTSRERSLFFKQRWRQNIFEIDLSSIRWREKFHRCARRGSRGHQPMVLLTAIKAVKAVHMDLTRWYGMGHEHGGDDGRRAWWGTPNLARNRRAAH
jgi:hypothetical protein